MYLKALLHNKKGRVCLKWLSRPYQLKVEVHDELRQNFVHFKLGKVTANAKMTSSPELQQN